MPTTRIIAPSRLYDGVFRLTLDDPTLPQSRLLPLPPRPYRPEAGAPTSLPCPTHEFGPDVTADTVGRLRYLEHRSIPEIHRELTRRGIARRRAAPSPTSWVATMSCGPWPRPTPGELGPLSPAGPRHPGHRWPAARCRPRVSSGCCCAIASPARSSWPRASWSSTAKDLAGLIDRVEGPAGADHRLPVSDGQESIRKAVAYAPSKVSRINSAISTASARRPSRSTEADRPRQERS